MKNELALDLKQRPANEPGRGSALEQERVRRRRLREELRASLRRTRHQLSVPLR